MTTKLLMALKRLFQENKRIWNCRALQNFFVIDHLGRIAGCHIHNFAGSVFDLPKTWNSEKFNLLRKTYNDCTQCGYCMPCPQKIPISFILELYNDACMYDAHADSRWMYKVFIKPEYRADQCTQCKECEEKCPQVIVVREWLPKEHARFTDAQDQ